MNLHFGEENFYLFIFSFPNVSYLLFQQDVTCTPVRQLIRRPDLNSPSPEPVSPSVTVSARIKELQEEVGISFLLASFQYYMFTKGRTYFHQTRGVQT